MGSSWILRIDHRQNAPIVAEAVSSMSTASVFAQELIGIPDNEYDRSSPSPKRGLPACGTSAQTEDVTILQERSPWYIKSLECLTKLSQLSPGWDSYAAPTPNLDAIRFVRTLLAELVAIDCEPTSIDPSVEGGVCISFRRGDKYADIESFNSGCVLGAIATKGSSESDVWEIEPTSDSVSRAIAKIRHFLYA